MGNTDAKSVRLGNLLTARTLVILLICAAKHVWFILEQPSSSLMEYHVLFQRFLALIPMRKLTMNMGDFGSATLKPTHLYSSVLTQSLPKNSCFKKDVFTKTLFFRSMHCFKNHVSIEEASLIHSCFKNVILINTSYASLVSRTFC